MKINKLHKFTSDMKTKFKDVEDEFARLRQKYFHKQISDQEFKKLLKELRIKDQEGRCWTIGARTGKWYYFDGKNWIESKPPTLSDGKAICIYCGYENDLDTESCVKCKGKIKSEEPILTKKQVLSEC